MDKIVILSKIESLRKCITRIEEKRPETASILYKDYDLQDIISINLERAIQICVDIAAHVIVMSKIKPPSTMGESIEALANIEIIPDNLATRLRKAIGFRNISVHEYQSIDWDIVFTIITKHISDFKDFVRYVLLNIDKEQDK